MTLSYASIIFPVLGGAGSSTAQMQSGSGGLTFSGISGFGNTSHNSIGSGSPKLTGLEINIVAGGNGSLVLNSIESTGAAHIASKCTGSVNVAKLSSYGLGSVGQVGKGSISLDKLFVVGSAHYISSAQGAIIFPVLEAEGYSFTELFYTTVLNPLNASVTEYTNFNFSSYCEFPANNFLGANSNGVFKLFTGDTDDGSLISARMEFGITDLSDENKKRVCDGYISYRGDGTLEIMLDADEQGNYDIYNVVPIGDMRLRNYRFKTSKYRQGKLWTLIVQNKDGANLDINEIALFYDILSRRI